MEQKILKWLKAKYLVDKEYMEPDEVRELEECIQYMERVIPSENEMKSYLDNHNETANKMEEETMPNKNYETINKNFGTMPLAGYLNKILNLVKDCDGLNAIDFLHKLSDWATDAEKESYDNNHEEKEFFFSLCRPSGTMDLYYDIADSLDDLDPYDGYDETKLYRFYFNGDWGLDEIKLLDDEYELVEVEVSRIREVKETATILVAVKKGFGSDAVYEAENYINNDESEYLDWEEEDEFYNQYDYDVEIESSNVIDTDTKENLNDSYDITATLE